jgi:hypothetical protein
MAMIIPFVPRRRSTRDRDAVIREALERLRSDRTQQLEVRAKAAIMVPWFRGDDHEVMKRA